MIKARVIKDFYCAKDKLLYLDKDRFDELKEKGLVEEIKETKIEKATKPKEKVEEK